MINTFNRYKIYFQSASYYLGSSLIVAALGMVLSPVNAMYMSHEDYAIIGYYSSFGLLLVPLLHLCLFSYYARQYYQIAEQDRDKLGDTILLTSMLLGGVFCILFLIAFYTYHQRANVSFGFWPYALLAFVQIYVGNISTFYLTKLRILREAKKYAILTVLSFLITAGLSLWLVIGYDLGAFGKLLGALLASCLIGVYCLKKSITECKIDWIVAKTGLNFTWPLVASAILWFFLSGIDRIFLEPLNDTINFGLYSIGNSISGYLMVIYTVLASTFQPDIYKAIAERNEKKVLTFVMLIIGVIAITNMLFVLVAPYVIGRLTAGRYVDASAYARIFSIQNIVIAIYYIIDTLLVGYGFTKQILYVKIISAAVAVAIYKILITYWQFYGAAWGHVLVFGFLSILNLGVLTYNKQKIAIEMKR